MRAFATVAGMYEYDNRLFDKWELPAGIDRDTLIQLTLIHTYNLAAIYIDWDFLQRAIGLWSKSNQYKWSTLLATTTAEYNPIENYDRKESYTTTDTGEATGTGNGTQYATAFNSNDDKKTNRGESSSTSKTSAKRTVEGNIHGNIGVTTTQQMLQSERDIANYNIYMQIVDDFKSEFCILVY